MTEFVMSQATIESISLVLQPYVSARRTPSWKEILSMEDAQHGFGELREPVDWHSLPYGKLLRIVYLVDELGPVIRWLLPEAPDLTGALGGVYHDHLERGDGDGRARSGWIEVLKNSVRVSS